MKSQKEISTMHFNYDAEGDKYYTSACNCETYYYNSAEEEILQKQIRQVFEPLENQEYNIVQLGPGNGNKTLALLENAMKFSNKITYTGIDLS